MSKIEFEVLSVEETKELAPDLARSSKYDVIVEAIDEMKVGQSLRIPKPKELINFSSITQAISKLVKDKDYKIKTRRLGNILIIFKKEGIEVETTLDELSF